MNNNANQVAALVATHVAKSQKSIVSSLLETMVLDWADVEICETCNECTSPRSPCQCG